MSLKALLILCAFATAAAAQSPAILSVSLDDSRSTAEAKLKKQAKFEREEEGQQIWRLNAGDAETVIVGYDGEGKVRYVTALARSGKSVPCELLGNDMKTAGNPPDLLFQGTLTSQDEEVLVIGRGPDLHHLASCSLKNPRVRMQDPDEEKEHR